MLGPSSKVLSMVDGGLSFFVGTGAVLLGLTLLEKLGLTINAEFIRYIAWSGILIAVLWSILKNPLFRSLLMGF